MKMEWYGTHDLVIFGADFGDAEVLEELWASTASGRPSRIRPAFFCWNLPSVWCLKPRSTCRLELASNSSDVACRRISKPDPIYLKTKYSEVLTTIYLEYLHHPTCFMVFQKNSHDFQPSNSTLNKSPSYPFFWVETLCNGYIFRYVQNIRHGTNVAQEQAMLTFTQNWK